MLARIRGRRSLHPLGIGFAGRLVVPASPSSREPLLPPGSHDALIRFSRGAGLPEPLPDALGIAVKLTGIHGPGADQDVLLTSSRDLPLVRRILFPVRSFLRPAFSTALPYQTPWGRGVFVVRRAAGVPRGAAGFAGVREAAASGGLAYELRWGRSTGRSELVGTLQVGNELPGPLTEALEFDPWITGPRVQPVGWVNRLRGPAYRSSQEARRVSRSGG